MNKLKFPQLIVHSRPGMGKVHSMLSRFLSWHIIAWETLYFQELYGIIRGLLSKDYL